jgi:catechol 2,3-dioxygenase-like lactoylglutathione lyase family enzyme
VTIALSPPVPVLRIFDVAKAREFYVGFLGMSWDWEHRFAPDLPLYAQVSRGALVLHLSEHHGDACPGAALRILVSGEGGLEALHAALAGARYRHARPGIESKPWGERALSVTDPFGNRLTFHAPAPPAPENG